MAARGNKRIVAHVAGMAASAGYWIASAADEVVMSETSSVGSIGVAAVYIDTTGLQEKIGIEEIEIISSQSPLKNAKPTSDEGRATFQSHVDALAEVFVGRVADHRGVSREAVLAGFGKGSLVVGKYAVAAGRW